jgi:hypothetical protein
MLKSLPPNLPILLDGKPVEKITAFLFPKGGNENPKTLLANAGKSFQGSIILGMGFTFDDTNENATSIGTMHELIVKDARNADRIFPYIGGEEVISSETHSHHRYAIDFFDMSEEEAWKYPDLMQIVKDKVKPERDVQKRDALRIRWWQYAEKRPGLVKAIAQCDRVLVCSLHSPYLMFAFLPSNCVFSHALAVFALPNHSNFGTLQSSIHEIWARFFGSSLEDRLRYTPSDCFETFPFPENWETDATLEAAGEAYYTYRAQLMVTTNQGLTTTYNRFHDPEETDPNILKLRELHTAMDKAVLTAYGWPDIDTTCEFILDYEDEEDSTSKRKKPYRYRWPQAIHDEVLARLLTLNQQRYDQEILMGKGASKKGGTRNMKGGTKQGGKPKTTQAKATKQLDLIPPDTEQLNLL